MPKRKKSWKNNVANHPICVGLTRCATGDRLSTVWSRCSTHVCHRYISRTRNLSKTFSRSSSSSGLITHAHQLAFALRLSALCSVSFSLFLVFIFSQGDYIKHPVLYELSHKYGLTDNLPESLLPNRLEEIKEAIRREIRKELKIKEGAEKLREVATDRRSLSDVASIVKKSNNKLAELKSELHELESQIILTQGNSVSSNGQGKSRTCLPWCSIFFCFLFVQVSVIPLHPIGTSTYPNMTRQSSIIGFCNTPFATMIMLTNFDSPVLASDCLHWHVGRERRETNIRQCNPIIANFEAILCQCCNMTLIQ